LLFNSIEFLFFFLPAALAGFQILGMFAGGRSAVAWLTFLSFVFYGVWKPQLLIVIAASIAFNYCAAVLIHRNAGNLGRQRLILGVGMAGDIGLLFCYKYLPPVVSFLHEHSLVAADWGEVILPLGISFFTFTQIGYLLDLQEGQAELEPFLYYCFFVTFFPHLIAGPIIHHSEIMPALRERKNFTLSSRDMAAGLTLFSIGLAKKTFIADRFSPYVRTAFDHPGSAGFASAWIAALSYTIQLYFDFSGYSDMAIGLAWMFSIRFPLNFNSPYKSRSIIEFWSRWHITLTRYLTMYIYGPMAMWATRKCPADQSRFAYFTRVIAFPTMTTMLLSGMWHGASLHVIAFGVLHGIYLTINQAWRIFRPKRRGARSGLAGSTLSVAITFMAVVISFAFFRAASIPAAIHLLAGMAGLHGVWNAGSVGLESGGLRKLAEIVLALVVVWAAPNSNQILAKSGLFLKKEAPPPGGQLTWRPSLEWALIAWVLFFTGLLTIAQSSEFLYFQF
jgi:alginate O-acetyltransferase complex protein AlgI